MQGHIQRQSQQLARARKTPSPHTRVEHTLVRRVLIEQQQRARGVTQHQIGHGHLPKIGKLPHAQGLAFLPVGKNRNPGFIRNRRAARLKRSRAGLHTLRIAGSVLCKTRMLIHVRRV